MLEAVREHSRNYISAETDQSRLIDETRSCEGGDDFEVGPSVQAHSLVLTYHELFESVKKGPVATHGELAITRCAAEWHQIPPHEDRIWCQRIGSVSNPTRLCHAAECVCTTPEAHC